MAHEMRLTTDMLISLPRPRWGFSTAAHLLNRAGFGGSPSEIRQIEALGMDEAVERLLAYDDNPVLTETPDWTKPDFDRAAERQAFRKATPAERKELQKTQRRSERERMTELRQWWLNRMMSTPHPLQEKLTLFWHGHFATSVQKVKDAYLMWQQNNLFRRNGSGDWFTLLSAVSKDPAMLVWLDQGQSQKENPNENFAREVMELFTLGEGQYSEQDVTEAARSFTGWAYDRAEQRFVIRPRWHDVGIKTVLGKSGNWSGNDVLKMIIEQPMAPRFITQKLWTYFVGHPPSEELGEALSKEFVRHKQQFRPWLRTVFRSEAFYASSVMRQQVKSPVFWLVNSARILQRKLPPNEASNNLLRLMGQELFAPPNVKGWDEGLAWITTNNLLARYNSAEYLVSGENPLRIPAGKAQKKGSPPRRLPLTGAVQLDSWLEEEDWVDAEHLLNTLEIRLFQTKLREKQRASVREYLASRLPLDTVDILHAIRLLMSTPDFQLT